MSDIPNKHTANRVFKTTANSPVLYLNKGKIILQREAGSFEAAFCIIKGDLPQLMGGISLLHESEIQYYNTLKHDKRRTSYLLGRIAAKHALAELINEKFMKSVSIDFGIFQFPVVKNCSGKNIQVSISHCDNIGIVLAFPEEHPLGVDMEKIEEDKIDAMKEQICPAEYALIRDWNLPSMAGPTIIWTIKEAMSKVLRTGLTMNFRMIEIKTTEKMGILFTSTFCHFPQYKAISCQEGNYACSILLPKNTTADLETFWSSFRRTVAIH